MILKNYFFYFLLSLLFPFGKSNGQSIPAPQNGQSPARWTVSEPFEQKVFIENSEGQLNGKIPDGNGKILCTTRITGVDVYFTTTGVTYRYDKFPPPSPDEDDKKNRDSAKPETHFFSMQWEGANTGVELVSEDEVNFYYCYAQGNKHTVFAHAFKKILYKNIYNGIDIEYSFPSTGKGLEYSVIVHPGADLSQVKLLYKDAENSILNATGDIEIQSSFGEFTDHGPAKVFYRENNSQTNANFIKTGNEISFSADYDKTKTLVIDPWTVNPAFTGYDAGYDIHYDLHGNIYVYGSFNPYQEIKLDSNGNIKWIFNAIYPSTYYPQFGSFAVDEVSGTSYLGSATYPTILKVNTLGVRVDTFDIGIIMEELWRMSYNQCVGQLVIGGGGTSLTNQVCLLDTGLTILKTYDILSTAEKQHDVALLVIDNANSSIYVAFMQSNALPSFNNVLVNCSLPSMTTNYTVSDNFSFYEGGTSTLTYIGGIGGNSGSPNGAVAGNRWLYMYDGQTLREYYKSTGGVAFTKAIGSAPMDWSGIDLDLCDNLYVADNQQINIYDTALNNTGTISTGAAIYDLHITPNNKLIVCGNKFISSINLPNIFNGFNIIKSKSNNCTGGVASVNINSCIKDPTSYSYLWSTGATTQTISGLSVGNYTVTVTQRCDFSITDTFNITSGKGNLFLSTGSDHILCSSKDTGNVYVTALYANPPFTYTWSNGATTREVYGLSIGTYSVVVTDSCGDAGTASVTIADTATFTLKMTQIGVGCNGGSNGSATVTVSGGTSPYKYLWSPNNKTTATITGLTAGTYTVLITDVHGCTATSSISITQPFTLAATVNNSSGPCSIFPLLNAGYSGGTPPYTYKWADGSTSSSDNVNTMCPGGVATGSVTITDSKGCTASNSIALTVPVQWDLHPSQTNVSCSGEKNGSITMPTCGNALGGYTYNWNSSSTNVFAYSYTVSNLSVGTYTVFVTDANGCSTSDVVITITQPLPLSVTITTANTCNNGSTATATVINGVAPYTYSWAPNGGNFPSATGLSLGTYTVNVTDHNGCTCSGTISITQPPGLTITATTITDENCYGGTSGSATSTVNGGTLPYTYLWSPSGGTYAIASGLSAGTYTLNITDPTGCTGTASIIITQPTKISATLSGNNVSCNGIKDGFAFVASTNGGVSPYTYLWSNGKTTTSINTLSAGVYTLTITDINNCNLIITDTITQPNALNLVYMVYSPMCYGDSNGYITTSATGGTSPYTFYWSPGGDTNSTNTLLPTGYDTLTITDYNGCSKSFVIKVPQPPPVHVTLIAQSRDTICSGAGAILLFGNPNGGTYSGYAVHGKFFFPDSAVTGKYNLFDYTYTDSNGCTGSTMDSLYVENCTGINQLKTGNVNVIIYPNPNNGQFTIESSVVSGQLSVEIYDVLGQQIVSEGLRAKREELNLSSQPNGVYLYRVLNKDGSLLGEGKIVIQK